MNATTATRKPAAGPRRIAKYHVPVEWVRGVDLCARSAEIEWYPDDMEALCVFCENELKEAVDDCLYFIPFRYKGTRRLGLTIGSAKGEVMAPLRNATPRAVAETVATLLRGMATKVEKAAAKVKPR